jgi:proteic killer suppression protein
MIKSFSHKGLKIFFNDGIKKGIQTKHAEKLSDILDRLDAANEIRDMQYPGSGLHPLEPKSEARWAVKVSANRRVTFRFENGDAYDVHYEDYH